MDIIILVLPKNEQIEIHCCSIKCGTVFEVLFDFTIMKNDIPGTLNHISKTVGQIKCIGLAYGYETTSSLNTISSFLIGFSYGKNCPIIQVNYFELCALALVYSNVKDKSLLLSYSYKIKKYVFTSFNDADIVHEYYDESEFNTELKERNDKYIYTTYLKIHNLLPNATILDVNTSIFTEQVLINYQKNSYTLLKDFKIHYL